MRNKKIVAGIIGFALVVLLLLIVNSMIGNPVSKILAKNAAKQYVEENYNDLNLELNAPHYNIKFNRYGILAKSKTSEDTVFRIYTDSLGNIIEDDYKYEVANCFTTSRRLSSELDEKAKKIIGEKLDYDFDILSIRFTGDGKADEDLTKLQLDMELNINNPPIPLEVYVSAFTKDVTWNKIAEVTLALKKVLEEQNIPISQYSIRLIPLVEKPEKEGAGVSWTDSLSVSDFPSDMLDENKLPEYMEQFENDRVTEMNKIGKK